MRYSIVFFAGLAALTTAAPIDAENTKQAADTSYDNYGQYSDYKGYGTYPAEVEKEAAVQGMVAPFYLLPHLRLKLTSLQPIPIRSVTRWRRM